MNRVLRTIAKYNLSELEYKDGDASIKIKRGYTSLQSIHPTEDLVQGNYSRKRYRSGNEDFRYITEKKTIQDELEEQIMNRVLRTFCECLFAAIDRGNTCSEVVTLMLVR